MLSQLTDREYKRRQRRGKKQTPDRRWLILEIYVLRILGLILYYTLLSTEVEIIVCYRCNWSSPPHNILPEVFGLRGWTRQGCEVTWPSYSPSSGGWGRWLVRASSCGWGCDDSRYAVGVERRRGGLMLARVSSQLTWPHSDSDSAPPTLSLFSRPFSIFPGPRQLGNQSKLIQGALLRRHPRLQEERYFLNQSLIKSESVTQRDSQH